MYYVHTYMCGYAFVVFAYVNIAHYIRWGFRAVDFAGFILLYTHTCVDEE